MKFFNAIIALCTVIVTTLSMTLFANSADKPSLTIYTYDAFAADWGPAPKIKETFEKSCNCTLTFVAADSSIGALRKVQLEGADTKADIILGLDTNIAEAARATGLFSEHHAETTSLNLPEKWSDKIFLPFDYSYFAFVYDTSVVKNPPKSFAELAAMPDDFKIVIQDPRSSTPGLGLILWVREIFGDKAPEYWKSIAPKILTVTKGWSDAYGLFLKNEADMVLSYTTSPAYHLITEGKSNYASANFSDGHYMQIEVAGILKSTKQPKLAAEFMQFMLSDTFQNIIPTTNWAYTVTKTEKGLPEGFETLHVPEKSLLFDGQMVEKNRKTYISEWLDAIGE
ncbi:MAG: thiamine ABC transporter substrate binding subunit [Rhizobiaceae bacterium]|nr:thiamine ABC transporter substrate binding subunit [Rhizobiaceae bacterium]